MKPSKASVNGRLWLRFGDAGSVGHGRVELLARIHATGSISQAARDMGMSYKAAWDVVESMNNLSEDALVERSAGGRHGGGTRLTDRGLRLIEVYRAVEAQFEGFLARLGAGVAHFEQFQELMSGLGMRTSARNELAGKVRSVTPGAVNSEVVLDIGGGDTLVALITNASVETLSLRPGVAAYALVKAPWVTLTAGGRSRGSARNRLCGEVETLHDGGASAEVTLKLQGGKRLTAIVASDRLRALKLAPSVPACALIKAEHVIVAVAV